MSVFVFFFYITIDFKTPIVSNKDAELASCNNLDYEQSQFIHPLNFKKFNIDLKIHEIRKWFRINLEDGVKSKKIGSFTNRKRVMGTMTFEIDKNIKCYLNVSIRAHGDQRDHRQGRGLPSLNVKILNGHIFGIVDFILLRPEVRKYNNEVFATALLQEIGLLAPRTTSINLSYELIEQKYIFQEKIVKEFLENFKTREGPIYEGDERFVFQEGNNDKIRFVNHRLANEKWAKKNNNNKLIAEMGLSILNQHGQFHKNEIPKNFVIDYFAISDALGTTHYFKKLPVFDAIMFSLNAIGNLSSQDRRFYFNTISQEFEPIFYDGKPDLFTKNNSLKEPKLVSVKDLIKIEEHYGTIFIPNLLNGKVLPSAVRGADQAIQLLDEIDLDRLLITINDRGFSLNKNEVIKALDIIKKKLSFLKNFTKDRIYKVQADLTSPIEAPVSYESKIKRRIVYYGKEHDKFLSCDIYGKDCQTIVLDNNEQIKAIGQRLDDPEKNNLIFIGKEKTDKPSEGWRHVVYLSNYEELKRNSISFSKGINFQSIGNIKVKIDKEDKKIYVEKKDNKSKIIFTGGELINWKIIFKDTAPVNNFNSGDINGLTGCVNFFKIKVVDLEIESEGSKCEDAVNFINVYGNVKALKINNSFSDALDVDFSDISFKNIFIDNSGNDCVDLSFGKYDIEKMHVSNCGDKGLSVGETSILKINKLFSKNVNIGIASKDYSKVFSNDIELNSVETCLAAYKKKQEFSGGLISVKKLICKEKVYDSKVDGSSKIIINNNNEF